MTRPLTVLASIAAILVGLSSLAGCARNAVLELELDLPASPTGSPMFAVVTASTEPIFAFDAEAPAAIELAATCGRADPPPPCAERTLDPSCSGVVSIVAGGELERPLQVRVRFCDDPECGTTAGAVPEHRISLDRAFYLGRYTQARACVDELPTDPSPSPDRIGRCEVRCRDGVSADHCRADGTHFCEPAQ